MFMLPIITARVNELKSTHLKQCHTLAPKPSKVCIIILYMKDLKAIGVNPMGMKGDH